MNPFIAGFIDELFKAASVEGRLKKRFDALQAKYEHGLSEIFDKQVPGRIETMLKRRFPKFQPKPSVPSKPVRPLKKVASFASIVHHPLTQAIGYAALAGEGAHALAEMGKFGPKAHRFASKTRLGRGMGTGSIGVGAAFLAAEAAASLSELFGKKRKKKPGTIKGPVIINVQPPEPKAPKIRFGKIPKIRPATFSRISKAIGFKK